MEQELFSLSEEERLFRDAVRDFAEHELRPIADEVMLLGDFSKPHFHAAFRKLAEQGFTQLGIPQEYGGLEGSSKLSVMLTEELCRIDGALGLSLGATSSLTAQPIHFFGTPEQKKRWLPRFATGDSIGCYCQTTPDSGSDVASIQTKAVLRNGTWYISGIKRFITNGSEANVALVLARTGPESHRGLTFFLVDMDRAKASGQLTVLRNEKKAGLHASPTSELSFDECEADDVLGNVGDGWKIAMTTLVGSRATAIPGQGVAIGQAVLEIARDYACTRKQFGMFLSEMPIIDWMLKRIEAGVLQARFLTYRSAFLKDKYKVNSRLYQLQASVAKLVSSELAEWASSDAMQILGGTGYILDARAAKFWHDGRIVRIYEGTSEVQELVIARELFTQLFVAAGASKDPGYIENWKRTPEWVFGDKPEEEEFKHARFDTSAMLGNGPFDSLLDDFEWLRLDFLATFSDLLGSSPPAADAVTLPASWLFLSRAYAYIEGAKLLVWKTLWENLVAQEWTKDPEPTKVLLKHSLVLARKALREAIEA